MLYDLLTETITEDVEKRNSLQKKQNERLVKLEKDSLEEQRKKSEKIIEISKASGNGCH